jgi:predicted Ser/Thr protein kinase
VDHLSCTVSLGAAMSKLRGVKKNRHIAGGFFGEVWQGEWEGVPVAIKVAKGASPKAVEALLREVDVAMSLKLHPNLVAVYGVCDGADGELQLVLEYCEDGALLDWLRRLDKVCDSMCGAQQRAGGGVCNGWKRPSAQYSGAAW